MKQCKGPLRQGAKDIARDRYNQTLKISSESLNKEETGIPLFIIIIIMKINARINGIKHANKSDHYYNFTDDI